MFDSSFEGGSLDVVKELLVAVVSLIATHPTQMIEPRITWVSSSYSFDPFIFIPEFLPVQDLVDEFFKVHVFLVSPNMLYDDLCYLTLAFPSNFVAIFWLIDVKPKPRSPVLAIEGHMRFWVVCVAR